MRFIVEKTTSAQNYSCTHKILPHPMYGAPLLMHTMSTLVYNSFWFIAEWYTNVPKLTEFRFILPTLLK